MLITIYRKNIGMTQEEKQLLLKDLSARLPYGVMMKVSHLSHPIGLDEFVLFTIKTGKEEGIPYLRPLSSMTEEERKEYFLTWKDEPLLRQVKIPVTETDDWLEAHHFDYRGLIEKGLALEAPEGMYNV